MSHQHQNGPQSGSKAAAGSQPVSSPDVLHALSEFESGLTNLKQLHAQQQARQAELSAREAEIARRDEEVARRAAEAEKAAAAAEAASRQAEARQRELESAAAKLQQESARDRQALQEERQTAATLRDEIQRWRQKSAQAESAAVEAAKKVEADRAAAARLSEQLARLTEESARLTQELATRESRVQELESVGAQAARSLEESRRQAEQRIAELSETSNRLAEEVAQRDTMIRQFESGRAAAAQTTQQFVQQIATLTAETARLTEELAQRETQVKELESAKAAGAEKPNKQITRLNEENTRLIDLLTKREAVIKDMEAEKEQLAEKPAKEIARLSDEVKRLTDQLAKREAQVKELESATASKSAKASDEVARLKEESARLAQDLAKREAETRELESVLDQLRTRVKDEHGKRTELEARLAQVPVGENAELQARLTAALAEIETLSAAAKAAPRVGRSDSLERRRRRLRKARQLVREQAVKLRKGGEALKRRIEMCDQVVQQRVELAAIRDRVIAAERKAQSHKATSRAAIVCACAAIVMGVLGGLSWAISREIAPASFVASSVIKADGRGRELNDAELEEWRRFNEQIIKDPRFHEMAAERFQRQGAASLSSASEVGRVITESMTWDSPAPGQIRIELIGQGADRTQRTLETITAAIASQANSLQQRQISGAVTAVAQPAQAGADPIDRSRTYYALAMLGVGMVGMGWLALFVWRRLSETKTAFERDSQVTHALDEANWPDPNVPETMAAVSASPVRQKPKGIPRAK